MTQVGLCFRNNCITKIAERADNFATFPDTDMADLTENMVICGQAATQTNLEICLLVGKMHALRTECRLTMALHRCNQRRLSVMLFGAAEPAILLTLGKTYSYTEWLNEHEYSLICYNPYKITGP